MKQLLLFFLFIPSLLIAQEDQKYLAGAVTEDDGKVVFSKEISMPSLSKDQIYDIMYSWAQKYFSEDGRRLVYSDKDKGDIAAVGEEYLVFQSTALSLDRSLINYRVTIECENNTAKIKMTGIRYEYNVSYQREPEKYTAEEWITDKFALNKKKDKLNRGNGKFRRKTIDLADEMFKSADAAFGIQPAGVITPAYAAAPVQQQTVPATVPAQQITKAPVNNIEVCQGLSAFEPDKIPSTLLNMLPESKMQVTPGDNESLVEHYATWKEMGKMFGKNIASISISPDSEVYKAIKDNDFYTISFTKQDEPETWFMIQCVKQGESTEGTQKIIIGEIINVWIR
ncbi:MULTISPECIES: DUF4468 domain-containing protein [Parabacteroides]|uniref:DUF4468 domain-containing protein n=1 Tax=Parabacteroides leei TaxID=2939491 RepID=UPI0018979E17|nr:MULTISPECIES: DUF4468 domain-containing protein [Parabacteroides]MCL3850596.1 DUF4468 domain-containing protein [Parabacteroides leei]